MHLLYEFSSYYDKSTLPFSICSISPEELLKYSAQASDEVNGSTAYLFNNVIFRASIPLTIRKEALIKWYASTKKLIKLSISKDRTFLDNGAPKFVYLLKDVLLFGTVFLVTLPYRALTYTKRTKR